MSSPGRILSAFPSVDQPGKVCISADTVTCWVSPERARRLAKILSRAADDAEAEIISKAADDAEGAKKDG